MKKTTAFHIALLMGAGALISAATLPEAEAASNKAALRKAAGKYKGTFNGTADALGTTVPLVGTGFVRTPVGKGKGLISMQSNGQSLKLPTRVKKATVKQGGKKVVYKGKTTVPKNLTMGFGTLSGPYTATATLKGGPKIKAKTRLSSSLGISVKGTFKGKK